MPLALTAESCGHEVSIFDVNPNIAKYFSGELPYPHREQDVPELLATSKIRIAESIGDLIADVDIIFTVVQTPHAPQFEGVTRLPNERADFNYQYLQTAVAEVARESAVQKKLTTLAVISTCLPGTFRREIAHLLNSSVQYVYNPCFPAMGNAIDDYLNSEFNLIGVDNPEAADLLESFYGTINNAPCIRTDITTAEGIKVSYNCIVTAKTVIANAWGELSARLGMNFDDIKRAWDLSTRRLISSRYLDAGMSDGGQCHPRDNIAMSWLAEEVGMSHNIWDDLMQAREDYEEWHARYVRDTACYADLPIVLLGRSFKPETDIETGSPALLMANILTEWDEEFIHVNDLDDPLPAAVYFIGTKNTRYRDYNFPIGSIVIDPFGYIPDREGVQVLRLGRR